MRLAALLCLIVASIGHAEDRLIELARLAPGKPTIAVTVGDLWAEWQAAPATGDFKKLMTGDLKEFGTFLHKGLKITPDELFSDVLGHAHLALFYDAPNSKDDDNSLLLLDVRDAVKFAEIMTRVNLLQKQSGEVIKLTESRNKSGLFISRELKTGGAEYSFLGEAMFAFSRDEKLVRAAAEAGEPNIGFVTAIAELGLPGRAFGVYLDPAAIRASLDASAKAGGPGSAMAEWFSSIASAADAVGLAVDLRPMRARLSFTGAADKLGESERAALRAILMPRAASVAPADAFLVVNSELSPALWSKLLAKRLPPETLKALEAGFAEESRKLLAREGWPTFRDGLTGRVTLWAAGGPRPRAALTIGLADSDAGRTAGRRMFEAAEKLAFLATLADRSVTFEKQQFGKLDAGVFLIDRPWAGDVKFCFAIVPDGFRAALHPDDLPDAGKVTGEAGPIAVFDGTKLGRYLTDHGEELAKLISTAAARPIEDVRKEFSDLADGAKRIGRVVLRAETSAKRLDLILEVVTGK